LTSRRREHWLIALGLCVCALAGAATTSDRTLLLVAVCLGIGAALVVARFNVGALVGLLILAQLSGVPGLHPSHSEETELLVLEIIVLAGTVAVIKPFPLTRLEKVVIGAASINVLWWICVASITLVIDLGTVGAIFVGGRDFLYIPIVAPLSMLCFKDERFRRGFLLVVGAGTAVFFFARIGYGLGWHSTQSLLYIHLLKESDGLPRVYTEMEFVTVAATALGLGAAVTASKNATRAIGASFALAGVAVIALQLTRAEYFGLAVGVVITLAAWLLLGGQRYRVMRRRVAIGVGALIIVGLVFALIRPTPNPESRVGAIVSRVQEGVSDLNNGTGTVAIREHVSDHALTELGSRWPIGLGFWSPDVRYFPNMPAGELRDSDIGVLNLYTTEGLIGTVAFYVPLLLLALVLLAYPLYRQPTASSSSREEWDWIVLGGTIWLIACIASSVTLVNFFSRAGSAASALVIGLTVAALSLSRSADERQRLEAT
jgi:hypothetical protein